MSLLDFDLQSTINNSPNEVLPGDYVYTKIVFLSPTLINVYGWSQTNGIWVQLTPSNSNVYNGGINSPSYNPTSDFAVAAYRFGQTNNAASWFHVLTGNNAVWNAFPQAVLNSTVLCNDSPAYRMFSTPTSGTVYIKITFSGNSVSGNQRLIQSVFTTTSDPICLRGDALVRVYDFSRCSVVDKPIKDIVKKDAVLSSSNCWTPVLNNIISFDAKVFYLLKKDCFEENVPSHDFYATGSHPIIRNNEEKIVSDFEEAIKIEVENPESVFSLITEERISVKINNLDVMTWSLEDWTNYSKPFHSLQ